MSKYKGCARSAHRTPIFASEQIQGLRAASAQNADICEGSETMSATVREARMIEQPGHLGRRPKATWRREQIQGLCAVAHRTPIFANEQIQGLRAVSAQNADICEGAKRAVGAASARCED